MRDTKGTKRKKTNLFISDREAAIIYQEAGNYSKKLQMMAGFGLFRGMRIGEIRCIKITDFKNSDFTKMDIILCKSKIMDDFPIIIEFARELEKYIKENVHLFRYGYIFPGPFARDKAHPHYTKGSANELFWRFRNKRLIPNHPELNCKINYYDEETGKWYYNRQRIGWHSLRRWFITKLLEAGYSDYEVSDIQRYKSVKTVRTYWNCYNTWKKEAEMLSTTFGGFFDECVKICHNQTALSDF